MGMATETGMVMATRNTSPEEITITRRLYRSGESEYLIDGKTARLRDIQDLFMGTGLGPESYAIIEQGRIGRFFPTSPPTAAPSSKKPRHRQVQNAQAPGRSKKLESAKQNLARVFDILEEVGRQVNSLKRQASKAKRYEELRTEMVTFLRQAVAGRFRMLEGEAARMALDLSQAQGLFAQISEQLHQKEGEHTRIQETCYRTEAELTAARARVAELNLESERTRGRLELQAKQIGAIGERLAANETETQDLETHRQQQQAEFDTHRDDRPTGTRQRVSAREFASENRRARRSPERSAGARTRTRGRPHARAAIARGSLDAAQSSSADRRIPVCDRAGFRARPQGRRESASKDTSGPLDQVKAELSSFRRSNWSWNRWPTVSFARVEEDLKTRQAAVAASRQGLEEARSTLSRQKARRESLEEILSHRAYTTESVKRLFTAIEHGQVSGFKPAGVLADFVRSHRSSLGNARAGTFLHEWNT